MENNKYKSTKKQKELAGELGFLIKCNEKSGHGQPIFTNGKLYISFDVDSHNGGVWKMAKSPKKLESKKTRLGTYDKNLKRIGD